MTNPTKAAEEWADRGKDMAEVILNGWVNADFVRRMEIEAFLAGVSHGQASRWVKFDRGNPPKENEWYLVWLEITREFACEWWDGNEFSGPRFTDMVSYYAILTPPDGIDKAEAIKLWNVRK